MFGEMLLTGRVASAERQRQYIETICRESERLSALIENVLDFAALERGKQRYAREAADLSEIVARAVETVRLRLEGGEMQAERTAAGPTSSGSTCRRSCWPSSTCSTTPSSTARARRSRSRCTPASVRSACRCAITARAFQPKRRDACSTASIACASPASTSAAPGIGLSLVKHIADAHGGRAWAENAEGGGAVVSFSVAHLRKDARDHSSDEPAYGDASEGLRP